MGWEIRSGKLYYYQKVREDGQVVSVYRGNSRSARLLHQLEVSEREEQAAERAEERKAIARMKKQEAADAVAFEQVELLTKAVLLAIGFHQHKGTWRLKRYE